MNTPTILIPESMEDDLMEYPEERGYEGFSEFVKKAIRDKMYYLKVSLEFEKNL